MAGMGPHAAKSCPLSTCTPLFPGLEQPPVQMRSTTEARTSEKSGKCQDMGPGEEIPQRNLSQRMRACDQGRTWGRLSTLTEQQVPSLGGRQCLGLLGHCPGCRVAGLKAACQERAGGSTGLRCGQGLVAVLPAQHHRPPNTS